MHRIILTFVLCLMALTEAKITTCDPVNATVDVRISNCKNTSEVCKLERNTNVKIAFNVTITKSEVPKSVMITGNLPSNKSFEIPISKFCKKKIPKGIKCSSKNFGNKYHYFYSFPIQTWYPLVKFETKWEVKNNNNETISCFIIPVQVVDKSQSS